MRKTFTVVVLLGLLSAVPAAQAQWAVVDVGAIAQLVKQIAMLRQQLETARSQLSQAQSEFQAITGGRGMEQLLSGTVRNYLPPDWQALNTAMTQATSDFGMLSQAMRSQMASNAVLTPEQLARLSPSERDQVEAARRSAALLQSTTQQALAMTSGRFSSLQQLITAIGRAQDQKAALDLQARIGAEETMLQNEQTKLQVLFQLAQAQEWTRHQRTREQAIADVGSVRALPPLGLVH